MENGTVIGLCGYSGSGKDCAAKGLLGIGWGRIAFADGIRNMARMIDPLITMGGGYRLDGMVQEIGWDEAKKNQDVRRLLQTIGSAARNTFGGDCWVRVAEESLWECGSQDVVFTDVRFDEEVDLIRKYGGGLVRITRPGVGPVNNHISETAIDDIQPDYEIVNDGSVEDLQRKLVEYAESLADAKVEG